MKVLSKNEDLCIGCHKCEEVCSNAFFKVKDINKASIKIRTNENGTHTINTCTQCGKCIDVCPTEAIYRDKNGIVRIKKDSCVGCLMCVAACPENAMFQHDDFTEPFKCVSCGLCVNECPTGAIFIEEK